MITAVLLMNCHLQVVLRIFAGYVNCRFCGAVHSVNWTCISVLSQVIHNVNERKTVQTNMISFVSHGAGILTFMEASAEHDCCSEAQRNVRRRVCENFSVNRIFRSSMIKYKIIGGLILWQEKRNRYTKYK